MTPGKRQNIKEKIKLFRFLPSAVNVKYKPFDISPLLAGERISVLFEIGASRPQYLYYVMRASYFIKIHVIWVSIIWYLRGIPWNEPSAPGLMSDRFDSNIISCLPPFRHVCPHLTLLLGNFPSEIKSLKIILRQKQELDVWMRARCCANRFVSGWRD